MIPEVSQLRLSAGKKLIFGRSWERLSLWVHISFFMTAAGKSCFGSMQIIQALAVFGSFIRKSGKIMFSVRLRTSCF